MAWWNDRFEIGDIVRLKENNQIFGRIYKIEHKEEYDKTDRYPEKYEWWEYYFNGDNKFTSYDNDKYELLLKEIGPEQIKEYDKILVAKGKGLEGNHYWHCDYAAGWTNENSYYEKRLMTISEPDVNNLPLMYIMPYNDETKKLIGTNYSRPSYYYNINQLNSILEILRDNPDSYKSINELYGKLQYKHKYDN